jgi:chemotaxis protein MotB
LRSQTTRKGRSTRLSHDRWLVSYADFITLLFAFFAMMYTVSRVDAEKMQTVARAMHVAFSDQQPARERVSTPASGAASIESGVSDQSSAVIRAAVLRNLAGDIDAHRLSVLVDRRGIVLSIPEAGTFSTGNDELSLQARALVGGIAKTVSTFPNPIRVEGHADNLPIRTMRFRSNWDLSAARASRVVELLIALGLDPTRLSATGYAEYQPRVPNDSDAARAANRRVDLVILNATTNAAEQPAGADTP